MLLFQYDLLVALAVISLWWPLSYLLSWFLHKRRVSKLIRNIPSLDDHPFLGSALRFMGKNNEELMEVLEDIPSKTKIPFVFWLGPKSFLVIDHPDDIQTVMNSNGCMEKGYIYNFFNRGTALFAAPAHVHKRQRKQLSSSFNNQVNWSFLPIFNQKSNLFIRNVGRHIDKGHFDVMHLTSAYTLDTVCATVLGTHMKIQDGENTDYMEAFSEWLSAVARRMANVFLYPDFIYKLTQAYRIECDWLTRSEIMPNKVIDQKMSQLKESNSNDPIIEKDDDDDDEDDQKYEKPQIFIDRLLKLYSKGIVTDQEIRDEVNLIIFAGHDTSAFTIAMAIFLLAIHPKIEKRVMKELNEVLGDQPVDADLTMEQVNQLTYLEQVIKETLRLYPAVPILLRHCTEDTKLANCVVPAGTEVVISIMTVHRRKDIWGDDADEFNPDHFSRESKRSPYAFMAFSNGTRYCVGQKFAFISVKIILAKLFRKYRISTHLGMDDIKFRLEVTCKPANGIMVEIEERT
ncbi:cytochrome P450 4c21-like [Sitodiplosis mosellana]|uniref:cytochrome P450 4c21-like n=1 Tax=Sitodiplosis mosellana TaxID=263140 RepID=UPI0024440DAC|nr:cytochrome P450 4c21-like [Sitodiplosis mosellana]